MNEQPSQPHVFLSYSHTDSAFAERLKSDLLAKGINIWSDSELQAGTSWDEEIRKAIKASDAVIMILSSRIAKSSSWVEAEYRIAKAYQRPVLPLFIDGTNENEPSLSHMQSRQPIDARE